MNNTTPIETRLRRLESQNRRLRLAVLAIAAFAVGGVGLGWARSDTAPDVISAKQINVVDNQGNITMQLGTDEDSGLLSIFDLQGNVTTLLDSDEDGGILSIHDLEGNAVVSAFSSTHGGMLSIFDHATQPVLTLSASRVGGLIGVLDNNKEPTIRLTNDEDGGRVDVWNPATSDSSTFWASGD